MRHHLLFSAIFFCINLPVYVGAQTQIYLENFDGTLHVTNGGSAMPAVTSSWFLNSVFPNGNPAFTSAPNAYRDTVPAGGASAFNYFITDPFDCSGNGYVAFQFNQICKISPVSQASIEVSIDGGANWTTLTSTHYRTNFYHPGSNNFFGVGGKNYFSSAAYGPTGWYPAQPTLIPDSTWWRNEIFDISSIAANQPDVRIRFKLLNFSGNGSNTREYGWLIDDINVTVAIMPPPEIFLYSTNAGTSPSGPFNFTVSIPTTGTSCCNQVMMFYTVNGGPYMTAIMAYLTLDLWTCTIPAPTINPYDTICYYFQAYNFNNVTGYYPPAYSPYPNIGAAFSTPGGSICFLAVTGISTPYYEAFTSSQGLWSDSSISGSEWQWGNPTVGVTSGCLSPPNCWDIDLHQSYLSNTHAYLYSPIFNITPQTFQYSISFWRNHNMQIGHDGLRLEYDFGFNGVWSTLGYNGDMYATNWYDTIISGSGLPAKEGWSGNTAGIWEQSTYQLNQFIGLSGPLQFRFVFDSDAFGNLDGVSVDDFYFGPSPTGIDPLHSDHNSFEIYPNPSSGKFSVAYKKGKINYQLVVTDVLGHIVWKESARQSEKRMVDLSFLTNGIYFVAIHSSEGVENKRILLRK